jgi:hypothetical protein
MNTLPDELMFKALLTVCAKLIEEKGGQVTYTREELDACNLQVNVAILEKVVLTVLPGGRTN